MNREEFKTGSASSRPVALWSLNHRLEEEEMRRQITAMKEQGLAGFVMHARSGLLTPYMSRQWLDRIEFAVREAKRQGLQAWLYDEDPYPSGAAGGRVTADRPDYRAQALDCVSTTVTGPCAVTLDVPMEYIRMAVAVRLEEGEIAEQVDLRDCMGSVRTDWERMRTYHAYYPTTFSKVVPQYRSDAKAPFYRLEWEAPAGEWHVLVYYRQYCQSSWVFNSYTDLLNPEAVRYFMDVTYEPYKQRLGEHFGEVIPGVFVDEPRFFAAPFPWTQRLPEIFRQERGYDIDRALLAMRLPLRDGAALRRDYWETVQEQYDRYFAGQIGDWCREHGLKLIGHASPEEDPVLQVLLTGSIHRFMQRMDIPGCDLITLMVGDRQHPILNMGPKMAASAARQWRQGQALCECFGVMEWGLKLRDMLYVANWLYSLGVTMLVSHTFIYSIDGYRKKDAGPSESYQMPYFRHMGAFSDYLARLGYLLEQAEPVAPVALLYPFDNWMSLMPVDEPAADCLRDRYTALFDRLLREQIPFEFVDYKDMLACTAGDGCMTVGQRQYTRLIVPPPLFFSPETVDKLEELHRAGVKLALGQVPTADGGEAAAYEALTRAADVIAYRIEGDETDGFTLPGLDALLAAYKDDLRLVSETDPQVVSHILLNHTRKDGRDIFFLFNTTRQPLSFTATLTGRLTGACAELYDPMTGDIHPLPGRDGVYPLTIPARCAVCVVADSARAAVDYTPPVTKAIPLPATGWTFRPQRRNCLILDKWSFTQAPSAPADRIDLVRDERVVTPVPVGELGIGAFPATVYYTAVVSVEGRPGRMGLVLEKSAIMGDYEITINGVPCGPGEPVREYDCNNLEIPITLPRDDRRFYRAGELTVQVKVTVQDATQGLLEPLRLFGDFTVQLNQGEALGAVLTPAVDSIAPGSWTHQGYPHFAGEGLYEQTLCLPADIVGKRCYLAFSSGGDAAEVTINGRPAGRAVSEPFRVEVTGLLQPGDNCIGIAIANPLQNLLYGLQIPAGLLDVPQLIVEEDAV